MSAKLRYPSSDENPDFKKRIGCINGLFHHFLGTPRIATSNHKTLPPGSNGKHRREPKIASQTRIENDPKQAVKEKRRLSYESPRTSFSSSSCSSSYSSADCTNASRVDPHRSSSNRINFTEISKQGISNEQSMVSLQPSQRSVNLRNVVKDCINREARRLSVKTSTKADTGQNRTLKYIDSPRPALQSPKPSMTSMNNSLDKLSHDLSRPREGPRAADERKDGSLAFLPMDVRRFSYDERGSNDVVKVKLNDRSRLSLDSREISMTGSSSVVTKLMGLETLPDPVLINENQCFQIKTCRDLSDDAPSSSFRIDENKKNQVSCSPRNSKKEPSSPRSANPDSRKPTATRCSNEPAPTKSPNSSLTVYGEIEKMLAELEFQKSGKDLRALKQILEAIQKSKQMLETGKDDKASSLASHTNNINDKSSEALNLRKLQSSNTVPVIVKGTSSPTRLKSPIKIIKPENCIENASNSSSSVVATGSLRKIRTSSSPNSPKDPSGRLQSRDKTTPRTLRFNPKLAMSSGTTCLKLQQQKLEPEKQPCHTHLASDQSRRTRQTSRLQAESSLKHLKSRHKPHNLQRSDDQISDISRDTRDLSHQGDVSLMQYERNTSAATYCDIEITSTNRSYKIGGLVSQKQEKNYKNPTPEPPTPSTVMEQPSPVSVLNVAFYGDESPSPVKKKSNAFKDYEGLITDEADWSPIGPNDKQLIFDDAVSEILVRKLEKESSYKPMVSSSMVVRGLCSEIDNLRTASNISLDDEAVSQQRMLLGDLMFGSMDWSKCKSEIPGVALDVERLIFKDLICEVISGKTTNPKG